MKILSAGVTLLAIAVGVAVEAATIYAIANLIGTWDLSVRNAVALASASVLVTNGIASATARKTLA